MTSLPDLADSIVKGVEELAEENRRLRKRVEALEKVVEAADIMVSVLHKGEDDDRIKRCGHPVCAALRALEEGK